MDSSCGSVNWVWERGDFAVIAIGGLVTVQGFIECLSACHYNNGA